MKICAIRPWLQKLLSPVRRLRPTLSENRPACVEDERFSWRERTAMLERVYAEARRTGRGERCKRRWLLREDLASFELGELHEGTVTEVTRDGIYVRLDGFDWPVHLPELAWGDITRPSEYFSVGKTVRVKTLSTPAHSRHPYLVLV